MDKGWKALFSLSGHQFRYMRKNGEILMFADTRSSILLKHSDFTVFFRN